MALLIINWMECHCHQVRQFLEVFKQGGSAMVRYIVHMHCNRTTTFFFCRNCFWILVNYQPLCRLSLSRSISNILLFLKALIMVILPNFLKMNM